MLKEIGLPIILSLFCVCLFAQDSDTSSYDADESSFVFKPTVSLGAGMLGYYGDISRKNINNHPTISRVGYQINVQQYLNSFIGMNFYVLHGKLGANERTLTRNVNFESTITAGGLSVFYNFDHILPDNRVINPYVSLGIESFEFLSKTDRIDKYGNTYYYWENGAIMNMPEDAEDASNAIRLQRDYTYETDIRELNLDDFGRYPERSIAIPLGIGANLILTEHVNFRIGTEYHYTFTDYIDGVTDESVGNRQGDAANDHFLFTSFSLSFNFAAISGGNREKDKPYEGVDFLALQEEDTDGDGVKDFMDQCPETPLEEPVDEKGCPMDDDGDGVPNYKDQEADTESGLAVTPDGIGITDSLLATMQVQYGGSPEDNIVEKVHEASKTISAGAKGPRYMVQIGEYTEGLSPEVANILLSLPDVKTVEDGETLIFTVGDYEKLPDAIKRKMELEEGGIESEGIVESDKGNINRVDDDEVSAIETNIGSIPEEERESNQVIYRVQIGAFREKVSKNIFKGIDDVMAVPSSDGITRYYVGSSTSYKKAASTKADMILEGFDGAFIVPFQQGEKISLKKAGATAVEGREEEISKVVDDSKTTVLSGELIKFRVQVGAYEKQVPTDVLEKFIRLGNVDQQKDEYGMTRFVVGSFATHDEAETYKEELINKGFDGAFVVGDFNGRVIPAEEAQRHLDKQE